MKNTDDLVDRLVAVEADNARLRRLLDEVGLNDSLRHAFRDTVALLRAVLRRSAGTAEGVEGYVAHFEGRLDAITRVRARTDAFGEADLHTLIADALLVYLVREGERATLDGPDVRLRPKAAQVLALAVHELASNAIEHGASGDGSGRVDVSWRVEAGAAEPTLALMWKESGGAGLSEPSRRGFGTAVLEDMLAYDLGGRTVLSYEPDGLRCDIRLPLIGRVGRLAADEGAVPEL